MSSWESFIDVTGAATESIQGYSRTFKKSASRVEKKTCKTPSGWLDSHYSQVSITSSRDFMLRNAAKCISTDKALIKEKYTYTLHAAIGEDPHHP